MKYAVLGPQLGINRISDTEPKSVGEQSTVVEITDEQSAIVVAGRLSTPGVFYFLIEGELKSQAEKQAENRSEKQATDRAARQAERLASMPPEVRAKKQLRDGLIQAWENVFTAGERAFLKPVFTEALTAFDRGDLAKCKEIVFTAPSISKDLDKKKAVIVGLFP